MDQQDDPRKSPTGDDVTTDTPDIELADAVLIDQDCFICVGLPAAPPDDSGVTAAEFHYAHGFADGVSTAIRSKGHHFCQRHHATVRKALLDRGVNWGPATKSSYLT